MPGSGLKLPAEDSALRPLLPSSRHTQVSHERGPCTPAQAPARVDVTNTPWLSKLVSQFSSVAQSRRTLCNTTTTARQASLSITNSVSYHKCGRHTGLTRTKRSTSRLLEQWGPEDRAMVPAVGREEGGPLVCCPVTRSVSLFSVAPRPPLPLCVSCARTTSWYLGAPHTVLPLPATRLSSSSSESLGGGHFLT